MKKAVDKINNKLNQIDFIIEVLDARAVNITKNNELLKIFKNKKIIQIALKSDLSDINQIDDDILYCSIKDKDIKNKIIAKLNCMFEQKINSLKNKGLVTPSFIGMVVGIPNVGKSSLINALCFKKTLKVENRSGVTKKQETRRITDNYFLIDTPGIFFKKIENFEDGCKLVALNNINQNIVPIEEVLKVIYSYFKNCYNNELTKFYKLNGELDFNEFIKFVAKRYHFILPNNSIDYNRTYQFILNNFSNANICKFHFE